MRCEYVEVPAKIPDKFSSFQCKHCAKKTTIPLVMKDRFDEIASRMPDCDGTPVAGQPAGQAPVMPPEPPISALNLAGPGTQLKRLLSKVGIKSTANCSCNARARKMDEMGIEWCEQNISEIVGWLKEEAQRRNLPFLAFPTKILVQRAISAAKRVAASQQAEAATTPEETTT